MKISNHENRIYTIIFSSSEFRLIVACLGNVTESAVMENDYDVGKSTGLSKEYVEGLCDSMRYIRDIEPNSNIEYALADEELAGIIQALHDTATQIGFEFHTVTGYWPEEALLLRAEMMKALAEVEG